jgi:predicted lysophospholipase L1 biosynthesis ABC-type transport system permease subunit
VVLEKNTANYILHLWGGLGEHLDVVNARGESIRLVVSGLLGGSILQGDLLLSEEHLLRHFPEVTGYRMFLIETSRPDRIEAAWGEALGEYGIRMESTGERLRRLLAVQNTYLSTFQSLGGVGLMLGTFGLAVVQLRNVLERRHELALLQALGFRRGSLSLFILIENAFLLVSGLVLGAVAAVVALLPHLFGGEAIIPWGSLAATLLLVLLAGLASSLFAVRAVLKTPLLPALRAE